MKNIEVTYDALICENGTYEQGEAAFILPMTDELAAEYLAGRGCKVSIVEMMDKIAAGESTTILPTLMENYKTLGVEQYPGHTVKAITMDTLVCEDKEGGEVLIPCDYVVMAVGARPAAFDASALENAGIPVVRVGDCADRAADISNAIKTAYDAACAL